MLLLNYCCCFSFSRQGVSVALAVALTKQLTLSDCQPLRDKVCCTALKYAHFTGSLL